jgi:transposase
MKNKLLTVSERDYVERARDQTRDKASYMKLSVLVMLDEGHSQLVVATALGISDGTVYNCKAKYDREGLEKYLDRHYVPYCGRLSDEQLAALETEVDNGLYSTAAQVGEWISRHFEVDYSESAVRAILKKLDFVHKKALQVPGNVDVSAQDAFLKELVPFLEMELADDEAIYFTDAVHPQHNTRSDYLYVKKGREKQLPSNTGRQRINLNGAMNYSDPTDVIVVEAQTIDGAATQQLFEKILEKQPDKTNIYIFADNAKYYYGKELAAWLKANPKIQIIHLPPYSPNLNLIERLWKLMRKKVINLHFHALFKDFRKAVLGFFENIKQYKCELHTLITPNFQGFARSA